MNDGLVVLSSSLLTLLLAAFAVYSARDYLLWQHYRTSRQVKIFPEGGWIVRRYEIGQGWISDEVDWDIAELLYNSITYGPPEWGSNVPFVPIRVIVDHTNVDDEVMCNYIRKSEYLLPHLKRPTEKLIRFHKMCWEI